MASGRPAAEGSSLEQLMTAVLALLVAAREDRIAAGLDSKARPEPRKTEVILASAGLSHQRIGDLLDKQAATVAKTISRAKAKPSADEGNDG